MFDAIAKRDELRVKLTRTQEARQAALDRLDEIRAAECPVGSGPIRPLKTRGAIERAREAVAVGELDASEVKRLEQQAEAIEREIPDLIAAQQAAHRASEATKLEIARLHREHFDAYAEHAREKVEAVERTGEALWPLLDAYVSAWRAAREAWRAPCRDAGVHQPPDCPLPESREVRGRLPVPPTPQFDPAVKAQQEAAREAEEARQAEIAAGWAALKPPRMIGLP